MSRCRNKIREILIHSQYQFFVKPEPKTAEESQNIEQEAIDYFLGKNQGQLVVNGFHALVTHQEAMIHEVINEKDKTITRLEAQVRDLKEDSPTCKTCKFWAESNAYNGNVCVYNKDLFYTIGCGGGPSSLITTPDFGCNQHKEKT